MAIRILLCTIAILTLLLYSKPIDANHKRSITADDYARAFDHGARVRAEGMCHNPHPTIVYVNTTDPSKVYMPRGTVLHRCSDRTGCCTDPTKTCEPIEMQTVELYFITITLQVQNGHRNRRVRQSPKVEKFMFTNHTLCGCRERTNSNTSNDNTLDSVDNDFR
ncbi:hypothetical protein RDWZM_008865 [Blomia tropicalis]|uniref:Platelet-derived growth factor (PDGF) family profile domain-containing protein n=1 Tax=Blomia tropicalis TaxID=40697 RepID=A0A9Q0M2X4_BLOTA|nr:hypothetical protein RDWZM_008865 [Blomia tropicalis]